MNATEQLWLDRPVTVALGQFGPGPSVAANIRQVSLHIARAADRGAKLVVLPEYSSYFNRTLGPDTVAHAEPIDGEFIESVRESAKRYDIAVVVGFDEGLAGLDKFQNTTVAISSHGDIMATYRKVHLFDAFGYRESEWVRPGATDQHPVFEVAGMTFGLQTCYDLRFPEITRRLINDGAEAICVPAQWVPGPMKELHWRVLLEARAIENTAYMLAADHSMPFGVGRSCVVDPMGVVVAETGDQDDTVIADISLQRLEQVRANNPALLLRMYDVRERLDSRQK